MAIKRLENCTTLLNQIAVNGIILICPGHGIMEWWNVEDPLFSGVDFNEEVTLLLTSFDFSVKMNFANSPCEISRGEPYLTG
jgi:hypothetical protein